MHVTGHARARLHSRLGKNMRLVGAIIGRLEAEPGRPNTVAYIVATLDTPVNTEDGSNGDTVVAVAVNGSVDTIYLRRGDQDLSAKFFRANEVVRL